MHQSREIKYAELSDWAASGQDESGTVDVEVAGPAPVL